MVHITNTESSRSGMATNATTAASTSNSTASTGFSVSQFESELAAMVNEALQAAGVSPSQASFSFNPTSSGTSTVSSSTSNPASGSQNNAATETGQSSTIPTSLLPFSGSSSTTSTASSTTTTATTSTSTSEPFSLTDSTDPVVGTEGLIYDPKSGVFGGLGAAAITDTNTLQNPLTGQSVSADLVIDGYEKIYGSDSVSLEGALSEQWGPTALQDYLQGNPGTPVATGEQMSEQTQTNFELYGPWATFTDPTSGKLSYFDANGVQYADGTGPASQMFNALGTPNSTGWDSTTAL